MGTRSLTRVNSGATRYLNLYRQMDGYPSGHGQELYEFLKDFLGITNGIQMSDRSSGKKTANGPGCLAAQLVAHFKTEVGGFYIEPTTATDCGQEYEYIINAPTPDFSAGSRYGAITVTVKAGSRKIFSGSVEEFGRFCAEEED